MADSLSAYDISRMELQRCRSRGLKMGLGTLVLALVIAAFLFWPSEWVPKAVFHSISLLLDYASLAMQTVWEGVLAVFSFVWNAFCYVFLAYWHGLTVINPFHSVVMFNPHTRTFWTPFWLNISITFGLCFAIPTLLSPPRNLNNVLAASQALVIFALFGLWGDFEVWVIDRVRIELGITDPLDAIWPFLMPLLLMVWFLYIGLTSNAVIGQLKFYKETYHSEVIEKSWAERVRYWVVPIVGQLLFIGGLFVGARCFGTISGTLLTAFAVLVAYIGTLSRIGACGLQVAQATPYQPPQGKMPKG